MSQEDETIPSLSSESQHTFTTKSPDDKWQLDFPWDTETQGLGLWETTSSWSDGCWFVSVSVVHYPQK